jgi:hypothetical protein
MNHARHFSLKPFEEVYFDYIKINGRNQYVKVILLKFEAYRSGLVKGFNLTYIPN